MRRLRSAGTKECVCLADGGRGEGVVGTTMGKSEKNKARERVKQSLSRQPFPKLVILAIIRSDNRSQPTSLSPTTTLPAEIPFFSFFFLPTLKLILAHSHLMLPVWIPIKSCVEGVGLMSS